MIKLNTYTYPKDILMKIKNDLKIPMTWAKIIT